MYDDMLGFMLSFGSPESTSEASRQKSGLLGLGGRGSKSGLSGQGLWLSGRRGRPGQSLGRPSRLGGPK